MSGLPPFLHQFLVDVFRLAIWLGILAALFVPLEKLFGNPARGQRSPLPGEIGYYFLNNLLPAALMATPLALVAMAGERMMPAAWLAFAGGLPFAARLVICLILSELVGYWAHRWSHEWPVLWQFHARHHQPTRVTWLTNTHAHPIDIIWVHMLPLLPIYALGFARPGANSGNVLALVILVITTIWSFFVHANLRWRLGPVETIVATPAFHHWHHTNDPARRDHNYAALLPVMDRLFGTHHLPDRYPDCYGIDDTADMAPLVPFARREQAAAAVTRVV